MKKIFTIILIMVPLFMSSQTSLKDGIDIKNHSLDKSSNNNLVVSMLLEIQPDVHVSSNRMITITPYIESRDKHNNKVLRSIYLYGRNREIVQRRENKIDTDAYRVLRRQNGKIQNVNYLVNVPYEEWMNGSEVKLNVDMCGCANANEISEQKDVAQINIQETPKTYVPFLAFVTPKVEEIKNRTDAGKAYLSFPINKSVILPTYGNNESELDKIKKTINVVKNDKNTSITKIRIVGYASPDGPYDNNARLSQSRAKSLMDYVAELYHYDNNIMNVSSVAEDWEGVKEYLQDNSIAQKQTIFDIINNNSLNDDEKELQIKKLGNVYTTLYNNCYPYLRRCDYLVDYSVRNFTLEEAKEILKTHPKQLSLDEMFRVAQTYKSGSPEYNNVFRTAVVMFPNDQTANLNASAIALRHNDLEQAQIYLSKSNQSLPETINNMGALMLLKGNLEQAKRYFEKAQAVGSKQATENLKLINDN